MQLKKQLLDGEAALRVTGWSSAAATEASSVEGNVSSLCGVFFLSFFFFLGDFHVCVPRGGGILSAERPSCGQKGVKEMSRLEFGTKLDTVPLNGLY